MNPTRRCAAGFWLLSQSGQTFVVSGISSMLTFRTDEPNPNLAARTAELAESSRHVQEKESLWFAGYDAVRHAEISGIVKRSDLNQTPIGARRRDIGRA